VWKGNLNAEKEKKWKTRRRGRGSKKRITEAKEEEGGPEGVTHEDWRRGSVTDLKSKPGNLVKSKAERRKKRHIPNHLRELREKIIYI